MPELEPEIPPDDDESRRQDAGDARRTGVRPGCEGSVVPRVRSGRSGRAGLHEAHVRRVVVGDAAELVGAEAPEREVRRGHGCETTRGACSWRCMRFREADRGLCFDEGDGGEAKRAAWRSARCVNMSCVQCVPTAAVRGCVGTREDAKFAARRLSVVQAKLGTFTPPNSQKDGILMGISRPRVVMLLTRDQFMHGAVLCRVLALNIFVFDHGVRVRASVLSIAPALDRVCRLRSYCGWGELV